MRYILALIIALTAGFFAVHPGIAQQFPTIKTEDLNGRKLTLPQDFGANRSVLLIAYAQDQQPVIDGWLPFVKKSGAKFYELPVLPSAMKLMSGFIENGMRSGIQSQSTRSITLTLYTNVNKFNKALGLGGKDKIHVVVVDRGGKVLGVESGAYSDAKAQKIRAAL